MANSSSRKGCLILLVPVGIWLVLGLLYFDRKIRDSYSGMWTSNSTADARRRDVLLREYVVEPRVLRYENYLLEFTDCWVEDQTHTDHDFIFFERVTKLNNPRLLLNYRSQRLSPDSDSLGGLMLVQGDGGMGLDVGESEYSPNPYQPAMRQYMDAYDSYTDTVYFSLIHRWEDPRLRQIRVYPKPGHGSATSTY